MFKDVQIEFHVQLVHNALTGIRTLKLRITSARHYPIECLLISTQHQEYSKHTFLKLIKGFLKSIYLKNL